MIFLLALFATSDIEEIRQAFREGRHADVVTIAERALAASDLSRPEILFWKGTSLARLGRHAEAVVAIDDARTAGFTPSELYLERALALHSLGRQEEAERSFQDAERLAQDDPERLAEIRRRWREGTREVEARITPLIGYDSNLFLINDDVPLLQNLGRESFYYGAILSARALLVDESRFRFFLDYQNDLRAFESEPDLSYSDNLFSALVRTSPTRLDWLLFQFGADLGESFLANGGHFRSQRGLLPAVIVRPDETLEFQLRSEIRWVDYHDEVPPSQYRDGTIFRIGIAADVDLGDGWKIAPYASYGYWDTEGSDYEHLEWEGGVSATTPRFWGLRATATLGYVRADFENPHTLLAGKDRREDDRIVVRLEISFPTFERALGAAPALRMTFERWQSNVEAWEFERWEVTPSVELLVLSF